MTPEERAAIVFDIVADGFTATDGDLVITASGAALSGSVVSMTLTATRGGKPIALDNPFGFVNPPLGVVDGEDVVVDPYEAARQMLLGVAR